MFDVVLLAALFTFGVVGVICAVYYREIKKVREEYERARDVLKDIIISFNRQLQRQEGKVSMVAHKTMVLEAKNESVEVRVKEYGEQLKGLMDEVEKFSKLRENVKVEIEGLSRKLEDALKAQKELSEKIAGLERREYKVSTSNSPEIKMVVPIKKETALAPLTQTELTVLELLTNEGAKTAPQIRERIKLTREHTARLMKKLYHEGYLERDTTKIPYTYRIKNEMKRLLKKAESLT